MPNDKRVTRKLSAILSADVKGYSLLMADDEVHTIQTLKAYRSLMSDLIQQNSGRVVDNPGDNLLAEFSSAVDAVECAVQIQNRLEKENAKFVEDKQLQFRIGVNIGDVVHDGDRIYGSGVNVAARIEGIAEPAGICISRNTYDHVKDKLGLGYDYLGEHEVKNIKEPVRVYRVLMGTDAPKPLVEEQLELPDKPSIAVLPFDNMSGDSSQEYFSDGLTEQIISGLCIVKDLFVIARNSSFAYKGKSISIKQIAKELGVRYILEGSVQRAGDRVRITAQLIDATTDYHMWSETYDRDLSDIFALQDEITMRLIHTIGENLTYGEQAAIWNKDMNIDFKAYDAHMRGHECFYRFNKEDNSQARIYYQQSIDIEPSAIVYVMIGFTHLMDLMYGWSESPIESFDKADKCSVSACELNDNIDLVLILNGWITLYKGMHDKAVEVCRRAVQLNPNGAEAHVHLGTMLVYAGNAVEAVRLINRGLRLNPTPPSYYYDILGTAYQDTHQFKEAVSALKCSIRLNPNGLPPYLTLASCYGFMNQMEKAHQAVADTLRMDPHYCLDQFALTQPYKDKERLNAYLDTLRKAGLPEHPPE
ncbi:adenylate/guanylate cyclase domain-containing protein [Thermodesulfobacteriota bacterium]